MQADIDESGRVIAPRKQFLDYLFSQNVDYSFNAQDISVALGIDTNTSGSVIRAAKDNKIIYEENGSFRIKRKRYYQKYNSMYIRGFLTGNPYVPPIVTNPPRKTKIYVRGKGKSGKKDHRISSGRYQFDEPQKYESITGVMSPKREIDENNYKFTNKSALNLKNDLEAAKKFRDFYGTDH